MSLGRVLPFALIACLLPAHAFAAETIIPLSGEVPAGEPDHFFVPFTVPAGTVEIEVRHDDLSDANILDWGLEDPNGFRGWGGGNEEPAIVSASAASRSYVPGAIEPGEWRVIVGKAKIEEPPGQYSIEVVLRDTTTLAAQPERQAYEQAAALSDETRWYSGDFHVHSRQSGDARDDATLDAIADFARGRGLDFAMISDHNVLTQLDFFAAAQARHPDFLFVPGMEYTTYAGHAGAIGATEWVDHKIGLPGVDIESAVGRFHEQGALFSINHPVLELGSLCIGCAWHQPLPDEQIDSAEIATGGYSQSGFLFTNQAIAWWDALCAQGHHVAAIGGSDDHRVGIDISGTQSPIGDPTTMVYAEDLSVPSIIDAVRLGRTVVKLQGPDDPMLVLSASVPPDGDTVSASRVTFSAEVTGGEGATVRFVHDGTPGDEVDVTSDPFTHKLTVAAPAQGESRVRAEVWVDGHPITVTSHLWLITGPDPSPEGAAEDDGGCGCRAARPSRRFYFAWAPLLALVLLRRRRRRAPRGR